MKDPYNPASTLSAAAGLIVKLALFYAGCFATIAILIRERGARWMLLVLVAAGAPLFFFAIVLFEPSSLSRYLPLLPFFYVAAIVAIRFHSRNRVAALAIAGLVISAPLCNVRTLASGAKARVELVRERRAGLLKILWSPATVYALAFDDFCWLPLTRPLDHVIAPEGYDLQEALKIASDTTNRWRAEFATHTLDHWKEGREIWFAERLLRDRPLASWGWVEGDDPLIHWKELPAFFSQFDVDIRSGPAGDGFCHLTRNAKNAALLDAFAKGERHGRRTG